MRAHYDFREAKRGRFSDLARRHVLVLEEDVWRHFGSDESVIAALRSVVEMSKHVKGVTKKARSAA